MIKVTKNGLSYYLFESFADYGLKHGLFTRFGGVSPAPYASLNLGSTTGDDNSNVSANRKKIFDVMGCPVESIFDVWQVHGNEVVITSKPRPLNEPHQKADGILTNKKNIALFMRFADCVPILLFAPNEQVIGIVHAGWQGTVKKIIQNAVLLMQTKFKVKPDSILAGIGPSICNEHYEVGENVQNEVNLNLAEFSDQVIYNRNGSSYFDLWKANALLLNQVGVMNIEQSNLCTFEDTNKWYSHRAEGFHSGRFGAFIVLE